MSLGTTGVPRSLVLASGVAPSLVTLTVTVPRGTTRLIVQDEHHTVVRDMAVDHGATEVQVDDLEMTAYTLTAQPSGTNLTIGVLPDMPTKVDLGG